MVQEVTTEQLKMKLDNNEDFYLVDVLGEDSYEAKHIPEAVSVPVGDENFLEEFQQKVTDDKSAEIVVYCGSSTCSASPQAAEKLEDAGYENVFDYEEGLAGWEEAGYSFA